VGEGVKFNEKTWTLGQFLPCFSVKVAKKISNLRAGPPIGTANAD